MSDQAVAILLTGIWISSASDRGDMTMVIHGASSVRDGYDEFTYST